VLIYGGADVDRWGRSASAATAGSSFVRTLVLVSGGAWAETWIRRYTHRASGAGHQLALIDELTRSG
jgi:hypothetical protein